MSVEIEEENLQDQFTAIIQTDDVLAIREFLNDQNISDIAELIYEFEDYSSQIIGNMSRDFISVAFINSASARSASGWLSLIC